MVYITANNQSLPGKKQGPQTLSPPVKTTKAKSLDSLGERPTCGTPSRAVLRFSQKEVKIIAQNAPFRFSDEEMDIAKNTDLPDLLEHLGYRLRRVGRYYTTREMDSIRIKGRRTWKRYSNGIGGDAITFLQTFEGKGFREAVEYLLDFNGRARDSPRPAKPLPEEEKAEFVLPPPNRDTRRVFAYLRKRGIDPQVIQGFIAAGLLYEDEKYHNCVFVGRDSDGVPRFASKRGTYDKDGASFKRDVAGSDKKVAFPIPCHPAIPWVLVFEAPIDLMSFLTLHPQVCSNAVALCGVYQGGLDTYLANNPHLNHVVLCLDADGPGLEAAEKLRAEYEGRGLKVSTRAPPWGKDWNQYLQQPEPPKNEPKKEESTPMADLEKLVSEKTEADALWKEQRQMERDAAISQRDASVNEITTSPEAYARYLELQADNPLSSAGNVALVMIQNPEATLFGTRDRWKRLGRFVADTELEEGAKIFVRSPTGRGYVLADTYDVSQIRGRDIPAHPQLLDDTPEMETAFAALLKYSPVQVTTDRNLDTAACYDDHAMTIAINPGCSDSQAFSAIAAEIALARFHDRGANSAYSREGYDLSAQSVSYILCRRFGVERELPDLSVLPAQYQYLDAQQRREALNSIQDMAKKIGGSIERSVLPPQRAAPAVQREER